MYFLSEYAARKPGPVFWLAGLTSLALVILVLVATLAPGTVPFLRPLTIDTDPENMLDSSEPVRVFHNTMKKEFGLYDMVVVGVVNTSHPDGVFNVQTLRNVHELAGFAKTLSWERDGERHGVIGVDLIAPSTVDNIEQAGPGTVRFEWLMADPPESAEEAREVAAKARRIPFLDDTMVSKDGKALALYLPISRKDISYKVASSLRQKIAAFDAEEEYHITGLPIAQDQFGIEMFKQMAISAPLAMALIFALMWLFFRNIRFIISPMIVAMLAVINTMGLLVVSGNTIHIMSSMIPIFIMPIAVLDAVHILSEFFDRYPHYQDRGAALKAVMADLHKPMLFTSLTTGVGFGSLALTPIPPVQIFGLFVGAGVLLAWLLTVTLVPAYIMLMPDKALEGFGKKDENEEKRRSPLDAALSWTGRVSFGKARTVLLGVLVAGIIAVYGITRIQINDNPVKWFTPNHEIRVADRALNERFGGTYMAYLTLSAARSREISGNGLAMLEQKLATLTEPARSRLLELLFSEAARNAPDQAVLLDFLSSRAQEAQDAAIADEEWDAWDEALLTLEGIAQEGEIFKNPEVLRYIESLQTYLGQTGLVGKSNSLPDIVKTVYRELLMGEDEAFRIPDTPAAVAQTLITFQSSHRPQDLWHFVTPDYRRTSLWLQLKSGDNVDMKAVTAAVDRFVSENPPPVPLDHEWFGLTYINVVWQQKMVTGMLRAFLGSFLVVLAMMAFLFRSFWWGLLSMVPLTFTIAAIYGLIGFVGKDYDMPVAILSSLSLGLAIDYAIHFLARSRAMREEYETWKDTVKAVFGEPARCIARNVIVIGVGFLPLLAAPLLPYRTVGVFISAILLLAGIASLFILPALLTIFENQLFPAVEIPENGGKAT
jgi:predicted RND superfamily exporter protein